MNTSLQFRKFLKANPVAAHDYFHTVFEYNYETGELTKTHSITRRKGLHTVPRLTYNQQHTLGYILVCTLASTFTIQQIVWVMHYGQWPLHELDHIDRDKTNNRINNLRDVTHTVNIHNRDRNKAYPNIYHIYRTGTYKVYVNINCKRVYLGEFNTPDLGIQAQHNFIYAHRLSHNSNIMADFYNKQM